MIKLAILDQSFNIFFKPSCAYMGCLTIALQSKLLGFLGAGLRNTFLMHLQPVDVEERRLTYRIGVLKFLYGSGISSGPAGGCVDREVCPDKGLPAGHR